MPLISLLTESLAALTFLWGRVTSAAATYSAVYTPSEHGMINLCRFPQFMHAAANRCAVPEALGLQLCVSANLLHQAACLLVLLHTTTTPSRPSMSVAGPAQRDR